MTLGTALVVCVVLYLSVVSEGFRAMCFYAMIAAVVIAGCVVMANK